MKQKLKCSECFQDLIITVYDCDTYVNPCECQKEKHIQDSWDEGYEEGRTDGHDQGWNDHGVDKELELKNAYDKGFDEGKEKGYASGYENGLMRVDE